MIWHLNNTPIQTQNMNFTNKNFSQNSSNTSNQKENTLQVFIQLKNLVPLEQILFKKITKNAKDLKHEENMCANDINEMNLLNVLLWRTKERNRQCFFLYIFVFVFGNSGN